MKMSSDIINSETFLTEAKAPRDLLESMLAALSEGKITEFVKHFDDDFTFIDHALNFEFTDKGRLIEFLKKSREQFPDTVVEVASTFEPGDHAITEWARLRRRKPQGTAQCRFNCLFRSRAYRSRRFGMIESSAGPTTTTNRNRAGQAWPLSSQIGVRFNILPLDTE